MRSKRQPAYWRLSSSIERREILGWDGGEIHSRIRSQAAVDGWSKQTEPRALMLRVRVPGCTGVRCALTFLGARPLSIYADEIKLPNPVGHPAGTRH